jgi:hypothetical protein
MDVEVRNKLAKIYSLMLSRLPMSGHLMWLRQLLMPICPDIEQAILPSRLKFCPEREQASVRIIRGPV